MQIALEGLARSRAYDVLHCFYVSKTGFMTVYAAREVGCGSVVSVRGNDIHQQIWDPARFGHILWALQHASCVTAVSTEAARRAGTISGRAAGVRVVLNSVDPGEFDGGIGEQRWGSPVFGTAGVLKSKKGVEFLLNAFVRLRDVLPNSTFLVVGDIIERERQEFASLVDRYELGRNLHVTGMVAHREMLRYMRCMDVFLHASLYDGCPNVVLEAFVAGVPVVATPAGAVPELIDDGINGILVETPIAMSEAAFALVRDGSGGIVAAAQRRAATQFLPSREADQFAEIYRSVIRRQTTAPRQCD
jgi:glycosyltransferase involved in cell wall biosynthesis